MTKISIDMGNDGVIVEAKLYRDGDRWCVMIGENIQEGVVGFGKQIWQAILEFKTNFRNELA